jgi:hypothetical protein
MERKRVRSIMKDPELVIIEWVDAFAGPQSWVTLEEYSPVPVTPVTVGWLIPDCLEGFVTTADTYERRDDHIAYYNIGHIPEKMVTSIKKVTNTAKLRGIKW